MYCFSICSPRCPAAFPASDVWPRARARPPPQVTPDAALDPGTPIVYADDVDIGPDGAVYFSDAQSIPVALGDGGVHYDPMHSYLLGLFGVRICS
jgi:hypothetical protein